MCPSGQVVGRAGGGLSGATWAKNAEVARIGQGGEVRTGRVLDELARRPGGPTVLHDLNIPIPGFTANIDHVVVSGRTVHLIDSKVWKPGFYWTIRGRTFRGLSRFAFADKKTMPMAVEVISRYLARRQVSAEVAHPLMVLWPSSARTVTTTWALRSPGVRVVLGDRFAARARRFVGVKPADPVVVAALVRLVNGLPVKAAVRVVPEVTDQFPF